MTGPKNGSAALLLLTSRHRHVLGVHSDGSSQKHLAAKPFLSMRPKKCK